MKTIFTDFAKKNDKGLVIFDAPVGIGKTTAAIDFIIDFINDNSLFGKERIIYITNLKTNLPYEDLKKRISRNCYEKNCVVIKPFYEMILDAKDIFYKAPDSVKELQEYKELKNIIKCIANKINDDFNNDNQAYLRHMINLVQTIVEPKFRKLMHVQIKYDENKDICNWLDSIYLTKSIKKSKVVFMSTMRFLSPIDTFDETYVLYKNNELLSKSILIIDEFDSTKQIFLDNIINKGIKNNLDLIALVTSIYSQINSIDYLSLVKHMNQDNYSPENIIEENKKKFSDLYNNYHMKYPLKQKEINRKQIFIFNEENKRYFPQKASYFCEFDQGTKRYNIVKKDNYTKMEEGFYLTNYIQDLSYMISYFSNAIAMLSYNLLKQSSEHITKEESIKSVLSYFKFNKEYLDFIYDKTLYYGNLKSNEKAPKFKYFYQHGFSIISVEESNNHILNSNLKYFDFDSTPEQVIFELCDSSLVFALSATASINSVVCNYSQEFLKAKLKDNFYVLSDKHKKIIEKRLIEKEKCFENDSSVTIHSINCENNDLFLDDARYKLDVYDLSDKQHSSEYYENLLLRIQLLYKELSIKEIHSLIMFFNKFEMNDINIESLNEKLAYDENIKIFELKSVNFNDEFKKIEEWLKNGKKALVYTTYNTLGTGKNIQYEIPDDMKEKFYPDLESVMKKDFDSIYLSLPTNLLENIKNIYSKKDEHDKLFSISNAFFQIEYLYKNGTISERDKELLINRVFESIDGTDKAINRTIDYSFNVAKVIIQAIGRICRTPNKAKEVHIYVEKAILIELSYICDAFDNNIINYEFKEILKKSKSLREEIDLTTFNIINFSAQKFLFLLYRKHEWSKEEIKEWKELREYVLKYPTDNCVRENNMKYIKYYYKFDEEIREYYYESKAHCNKIYYLTTKRDRRLKSVSDSYAKLNVLIKNESIKELFNRKKYAKRFEKNKYIMCPIIFQSVYLGALGEVCGKFILEDLLDIKLTDVNDDYFEYFDFVYNDYYFDFKNWISCKMDRETIIPKIVKKLKKLNGKKVFVINLISESDVYVERIDDENNIIEIPCLIDSFTSEISIRMIDAIKSNMNLD